VCLRAVAAHAAAAVAAAAAARAKQLAAEGGPAEDTARAEVRLRAVAAHAAAAVAAAAAARAKQLAAEGGHAEGAARAEERLRAVAAHAQRLPLLAPSSLPPNAGMRMAPRRPKSACAPSLPMQQPPWPLLPLLALSS